MMSHSEKFWSNYPNRTLSQKLSLESTHLTEELVAFALQDRIRKHVATSHIMYYKEQHNSWVSASQKVTESF